MATAKKATGAKEVGVLVNAYILIQTEVGRAAQVAKRAATPGGPG